MLDVHSHILPGVDHGAQDLTQARAMLAEAQAQGIDTIVATPHVYKAEFDRSIAQNAMEQLRPYARQMGIALKLGYEFNHRAFDREEPQRAREFCIEDTNLLLLELPFDQWPRDWKNIIYDLQAHGMEVILAHPERYVPIQKDLRILEQLAQLDCLFQVDVPQALRLLSKQNRVCKRLVEMDLLHYAASDAHTANDYQGFRKSIDKLGGALQYMDWK